MVDIEECDISDPSVNSTKIAIQFLQVNDSTSTRIRYCKIEIKRTVQSCGMFSHTSPVRNSKVSFLRDVSREKCMTRHLHRSVRIINNGTFQLPNSLALHREHTRLILPCDSRLAPLSMYIR